jgi:pyrroloquinoline quinone biosynthesis protein D
MIDPQSKPRLALGCRLNDPGKEPRMLLMPERALRLQGPSFEIIERCDGQHTVAQIVAELQNIYRQAAPEKVAQDIVGYLKLLQDQRALDL